MKQQILRVQNDYDRLEERLGAVESNQAHEHATAVSNPVNAERPALKVVRMSPDDEDAPSAPEEPVKPEAAPPPEGPRPMIKGSGDKVYATGDVPSSSGGKASRATLASGEKR